MAKQGAPKTKILFGIILALIIILGAILIITTFHNAKKVSNDLRDIRTTVESVNTILIQFQEFPEKVEDINQKISNIETKLNKIEIDANSLSVSDQELKNDLEELKIIKEDLKKLQNNLVELQKVYPPVQTQNIIFQNATDEDVTEIVTNVINKRSTSLIISFTFGSIIGITLFQLTLFIYKKYKNKPKDIDK